MTQRWTIDTADDRFGDGKHHPYLVEGVTHATAGDGVLHLWAGSAHRGSFPLANITGGTVEGDGSPLPVELGVFIERLGGRVGEPSPEGADDTPQQEHAGEGTAQPDPERTTRKGDR